jgi:simple sugar transport system permease protein/ribose transport system permease protein
MRNIAKVQLTLLDNLVWLLLLVFFLFNSVFTTNFFSLQNMINILYQTTVISLLVLAQGIVMMVGELDLSIDSTLAFAPGVAVLAAASFSWLNPVFTILLTFIVGAAVGLVNGLFVAKMKANSFLLTLSTEIAMRGLVLFWVPFSIAGLHSVYAFLGKGKIGLIPVAVIAVLVIYAVFEFIFRKTIFGRKFLLTGGNRRASFISGINTDKVMIWAFVLAGILAAVAGLITAGRQGAVSNVMGKDLVMMAFAGAILGGCSFNGGMGKPIGMLGGALLLGMIDNSLNLMGVNVNLVSATKGALIFVAILLDRIKFQLNARILHRENIFKLEKAGGGT